MGRVAAPEWLEQGTDTRSPAAASPAAVPPARVPLAGAGAMVGGRWVAPVTASVSSGAGCAVLLSTAGLLLEQCAGVFDAVVLAQLDAALAHELAGDARRRAVEGAERLEQQVRAGAAAGNLADLAQFVSTARGTATKAQAQAVAATEVVLALGGTLGNNTEKPAGTADTPTGTADIPAGTTGVPAVAAGFDAAVVDRVDPAALVEVMARLEEVKNAAAAAQAQAQAVFVAQQRLLQARSGVPREKLGKGVAEQVGLARHESASRGRMLCGLAHVVVREMPHTMNAFSTGILSEYRAGILARETACLSAGDRARVDALVCADPEKLATMGSRELAAAAKNAALALDPAAVAKRFARTESERNVSLRPAADGMTLLSALVPLRQGVRAYNLLTKIADSAKAAGDDRGKGQLMADTLLHRLTRHTPCTHNTDDTGGNQDTAGTAGASGTENAAGTSGRPADWTADWTGESPRPGRAPLCTTVTEPDIALELIMTDRALFDGASDPALLVGHEPIPAPAARAMIYGTPTNTGDPGSMNSDSDAGNHDGDGAVAVGESNRVESGAADGRPPGRAAAFSPRVWIKRLFTHPETNALLAMDSKGRLFPEGMKEFLRLRDQTCATPYCDAPIRDYDHIKSWAAGGHTSIANGQGMCRACNQAKEAPGWTSTTSSNGTATPETTVTTPTGHRYISTAPPLPGPTRRQRPQRR